MDDRSLSPVISYILMIGIIAILTAALVTSFAPLVTNQQDSAIRSTLTVLGQDVAGDIESVDRLSERAGENGTVELRTELPERVGGSLYTITVQQQGDGYEIRLRTADPEVSVTVSVLTGAAIAVPTAEDTLDGRNLVIRYEESEDTLVIENA